MSSSIRLRETHAAMGGALGIQSAQGVRQEMSVKSAVFEVIETLRKKYPTIQFTHEKTLDLEEVCIVQNQLCEEFGVELDCKDSLIRPDGGFVFAKFNGVTKLVLSCEAKRQGTNDALAREGKPKQSAGNAIERMPKNYHVICKFMDLEPYLPYVVFASGCDLKKGSSIRDRIASTYNYSLPNKIYVRNVLPETRNIQRLSMFVREKHWPTNEVYDICLKVAEEALDVVFSIYGRNDIAA
jgi:hypothetical protein